MKYYSKSPEEFRRNIRESNEAAQNKRKKSYLLQFANFGILMVALFLMYKNPAFIERMAGKKKEPPAMEKSRKNLVWKGLSLESSCKPGDFCSLYLTKEKENLDIVSFFWKVEDKETGSTMEKTFELIPKDMKKDETTSFHLPFKNEYTSANISIHFMDKNNEEQLSMEIYP